MKFWRVKVLLLEPESGTFRSIFQHFPCQKSFHRNNNPLIMSKLTKRCCFLKKSGQKWGSLQKGAKIVRLSLFFLSILTFQKMRVGKSPCILLIQIKTPFPRLNNRLWSHKTQDNVSTSVNIRLKNLENKIFFVYLQTTSLYI